MAGFAYEAMSIMAPDFKNILYMVEWGKKNTFVNQPVLIKPTKLEGGCAEVKKPLSWISP